MRYRIRTMDDSISWSKNKNLHRLYGPAVQWIFGGKEWYKNNKLHRKDGPAREFSNGYKYWWIDGHLYSEEEFKRIQAGEK